MHKNDTKSIILGLGFIFVTILVFKSQHSSFNFNQAKLNYINYNEINTEIKNILKTTPSLWRKFTFTENETVATRIAAQRLWIERISSTDFIKSAKVKKVLLQNYAYYFTNDKLNCPYARQFENKCQLFKETSKDVFIRGDDSKYVGMDGYVGTRGGNWKFNFAEKIVPHGVQQIMYILEAPTHAKYAQIGRNNALLASYWRGSDIPIPYRQWVPKNRTDDKSRQKSKHFSNKTKQVAALISNCDSNRAAGYRLEYIRQLKEYIDVDFYGYCGDLECPKDCLTMLEKNYKFYLAFENSNCIDYITEKFFINALSHDMLPIVMGAHPENYISAAPPNSFIYVEDFESPKALAEYLHVLDKNESLYQEYFQWKGTGEITHDALHDFFCRVCGMLFYADFVPIPSWNSEMTTFADVNQCLPQNQKHWS